MRRSGRGIGLFVLVMLCIYALWLQKHTRTAREQESTVNPLDEMLRVPPAVPRQEGTAAAILMDTSGSMRETVPDADGRPKPKIEIARQAAANLLRRFADHARNNPARPLLVGIYEFSTRDNQPSCRAVTKLGPPHLEEMEADLATMFPEGGTPIGDAMILAKKDLDRTGMSHRHILVITDGENNRGYSPGAVAGFLARQPEEARASVYFIAFDVEAAKFHEIKESGGLVLAAANERDLGQTLDFILTGKILAEQPSTPAAK
ncbi:MAG TPA: vWA domain-containing protein [Acidobacteriota bacterium]|nr:vWA domain-containing protein [Acidobacteriota bacterium]